MPPLRQSLRVPRHWILVIAAVALAAAAICDWTRPPRQQITVALYEKTVIGGYRLLLKPLSDRFFRCRFQPTCSVYSEEAMRVHGFPRGLWLTTARLFRCMPWVPVGTRDPVPCGDNQGSEILNSDARSSPRDESVRLADKAKCSRTEVRNMGSCF